MEQKDRGKAVDGGRPEDDAIATAELEELDDETVAALNEAEAQADRGEGVELEIFRNEFRRRFK